jgi:glycosyltransferase involved in cell wall biosynthesis
MVRKLRVAVYHNLHSGGAKHSLYEIVRRLARRHRVDLFCPSTADTDFSDLRGFVEENVVFEFEPGRLFRSPFGRLNPAVRWHDLARLEQIEQRIAAEIDRRGYDVVYVQPCQFTQNPSLLCTLQTPSLYHSHEPFRRFYEPPRPRLYRDGRARLDRVDPLIWIYNRRLQAMERRNIGFATRIVTNSYFTREALYRIYGVDARVVYHGVDLDVFHPLDVPKEDVVLSVGALTSNKGFDFIVESLGLIPERLRPTLVVVSNYQEPAERAYLEKLAAERGVNLTLRVRVPFDELVRLYNVARCTVYAPIMEPFGLVPLESMACGTPVVGVREGGVRESVMDGCTGLLVDREPKSFSRAVETLLQDEALATQLGQQARECVATEWTWEKSVQELELYLQRVAGSAQVRGG